MNKRIFKIIQLLATILLILLVCYQVGLFSEQGRDKFINVLKNANLNWLIISVLVGVLVNLASALKWYMLTQARFMKVNFLRIFAYYLIGQFYNIVMPTSVGGDVVRSYQLGKFTGRQSDALASVFVERYSGVVVLLIIALLAVLTQLATFNVSFVMVSLIVFSLGLGLIGWMIYDNRLYKAIRQGVSGKFRFTNIAFNKLDQLLASLDDYKQDGSALVWALINSILFYFLAVVNVYVSARVFSLDVQFVDVLIATPIIMLIMNIPLSIGNLGLMEFAYITIFQMMGYPPELGLSVAVLMRLKSLLDALMGGVFQAFYLQDKAPTTEK